MADNHQRNIHEQFDPRAQAYLDSKDHAAGPDLDQAAKLVSQLADAPQLSLLDIGCGGGHLSYRLAPLVKEVVASDPSASMLTVVKQAAAQKQLSNITTCEADATALPFDDNRFDIVATRMSAHHWVHLQAALHNIYRVVKRSGHILIIDTETLENALVDTHLQTIELLRDRSHVRDRAASEWESLLHQAGFTELTHQHWSKRLAFGPWIERMQTPAAKVEVIRTLQAEAPKEVAEALTIEADGTFTIQTGLWWGLAR